ncbi:hypothetical protein C2S51_007698 [Perilla frutescens var. frutescens]|nr:hypothetical protein C2S51_007698 [Perilla frutescens var. frutescens]
MSLGKRARPPMKRTASMTEFTLDLINGGAERVCRPLDPHHNPFNSGFTASAAASPRLHRHNSADSVKPSHFLRACSLCKRRLIPGRDIYMYRGDSAFCSLECRQHQMTQDERKEKCSSLASKMEVATAAAVTHVSATGETVAAAV